MTPPIQRLFVIWRDAVDGTRHVIGQLWRDPDGYAFGHVDTRRARDRGFMGLEEFPDQRPLLNPYRAPRLFSTFAQRVPSAKRSDRAELLAAWHVENPDDPLEVLARSGGFQLTDSVELAEFRDDADDLRAPLEVRIAGMKHQAPVSDALRVGDELLLEREPANAFDPSATVVLTLGGSKLGYVPRQYSGILARLLDGGAHLGAVAVRQLVIPAERGRWIVRLWRRD